MPGRRHFANASISHYPPFEAPFTEDTILKVSENGQVISETSVPLLFYKNGLEAILTSGRNKLVKGSGWSDEIVHLNKVDELQSAIADDFPMFRKGYLALSLRKLNLIVVINPVSGDIKWLKVWPWLRQHDPEFKQSGTILVFNNNIFQNPYRKGSHITDTSIIHGSNIVEIDPVSNKYSIVYGDKGQQNFLSAIRGKHEITADGSLLITGFQAGRVFEINASGNIIWEYINRYSEKEVAEITEARIYSKSYFNVTDWSCT